MPLTNRRLVNWRARRLTDKQFVYGQLLHFGSEGWIYENPHDRSAIDVLTKGESIGISDKNGQDVYEGDLLIIKEDTGEYGTYVVVHRGCGFVGKHFSSETYTDLLTHSIEVVGQYYSSDMERELQEIKLKINALRGVTDDTV